MLGFPMEMAVVDKQIVLLIVFVFKYFRPEKRGL